MSAIQIGWKPVYLAPTKGRHYLTPKAAAFAEARAQMNRKYPEEKPEYGPKGGLVDGGWHWSCEPHHVAAYERLSRCLLKRLRATMKARSA